DDGGVTWQGLNRFNNLPGGVYNIVVSDGEVPPVQKTQAVPLGNIAGPSLTYTPNPASCLNNDGELDLMPIGGTSPFTYSVGGGPPTTGNLIGGLPTGNVFVTVTDRNGCSANVIANVPFNDNETLTVGAGTTVCQGVPTPLTVTSNATSYAWTPATGLNDATAQNPMATPSSTTTYTVNATLGICSQTGSVTINVLPAPVPMSTGEVTLCPGQSTQLQGSGGVSYQWSPATYLSSTTVPDPVVNDPQQSITYSLNVVGANGCSSIQPALSLVVVTPPPKVFAGNDTAILVGQTLQLNAVDVNNSGFTNWAWTPAIGLDNPSIQDPVATITSDITYVVTATTPAGCTGTDSIKIITVTAADIIVPNAFTPNGDGHNDLLHVHAIAVKDFQFFRVFNRWGRMVFQTTNLGEGWDGTAGGQAQPMGTYVWVAGGLDFTGRLVERQGTVILVR
ncbi:MAG TPA: gliding motility-associated C-terminal domain-containing protein, partial [Puia sp.]|nr:gliding motility-associated C-terminal domain-containing protein [Puia sp.]